MVPGFDNNSYGQSKHQLSSNFISTVGAQPIAFEDAGEGNSMIFGDPTIFAIECTIDEEYEGWFYGRTVLWLAAKRIGTSSVEVVPMIAGWMYRAAKGLTTEPVYPLAAMDSQALIAEVQLMFGTEVDIDRDTMLKRQEIYWSSILFAYDQGFEHDVLIHHKHVDMIRFVWHNEDLGTVYEQHVPIPIYTKVLHAYLTWITQMTGHSYDLPLI